MNLVVHVLAGKDWGHVVEMGGGALNIADECNQHKEDHHSSLELTVRRDLLYRDLDLLGHAHIVS